jgi:hypothetical protein
LEKLFFQLEKLTQQRSRRMNNSTTDHISHALDRIGRCAKALERMENDGTSLAQRAINSLEECTMALRDVTQHLCDALKVIEKHHSDAGWGTADNLGDVIYNFSKSQARSPATDELAQWLVNQMMGKKPTDA